MTAPKVGDCVRAHGGRKVCRVSKLESAKMWGRSWRGVFRACVDIYQQQMYSPKFGRNATHRKDGTRFAACGSCWPDGITEGES